MWGTLKAPGQSVLEFGRERAARATGGFSWRNAVIAEIDGEIAASLVGYRLDDPYDLDVLDETPEIVRPLVCDWRLRRRAPGISMCSRLFLSFAAGASAAGFLPSPNAWAAKRPRRP